MALTIVDYLTFLYGERGEEMAWAVEERLERFRRENPGRQMWKLDHSDAVLITYGDQFQRVGETPLQTLYGFCTEHFTGAISGVHVLPFFPYTSDDGFSVSDYRQVDPELGVWADIERLAGRFRLMADAVLNHCSSRHPWFRGFLAGDPRYTDYFITLSPETDLSAVVRPRALPMLTPFDAAAGRKWVWTTFSADQADLNFANPAVLLEMADVLLDYIAHGAQLIRLDAIAYLWKQVGTGSIHLPQTHAAVKFFRALAERAAPGTVIVTETNVAHTDNISYFGDGTDEAQMVYNFALPPLTLHALQTGDGRVLTEWAAGLSLPSQQTTFFNFLASHDGIGLNPARGILTEGEIERMIDRSAGAGHGDDSAGLKRVFVSYKNNPDGSQSPYELNANYLDALGGRDDEEAAERFLAAHAIMLTLKGVPGIYVHSLLGSRGWPEGVALIGQKRTVNREKFSGEKLGKLLAGLRNPSSRRARVLHGLTTMLRARAACPAFDPFGSQRVLKLHSGVFAVLREAGGQQALCLVNLRAEPTDVQLPGLPGLWRDILASHTGTESATRELRGNVTMQPYAVLWLEKA